MMMLKSVKGELVRSIRSAGFCCRTPRANKVRLNSTLLITFDDKLGCSPHLNQKLLIIEATLYYCVEQRAVAMLNGAGPMRDPLKPVSAPSPLEPIKKSIVTLIKRVVSE